MGKLLEIIPVHRKLRKFRGPSNLRCPIFDARKQCFVTVKGCVGISFGRASVLLDHAAVCLARLLALREEAINIDSSPIGKASLYVAVGMYLPRIPLGMGLRILEGIRVRGLDTFCTSH